MMLAILEGTILTKQSMMFAGLEGTILTKQSLMPFGFSSQPTSTNIFMCHVLKTYNTINLVLSVIVGCAQVGT